ncbi:hypothetical protein Tco_0832136, partial [Tanacetum coccineum]
KFFCIIKSIIPNKDAEVAETRKYDEEITYATKVDSEKTKEVKGDNDRARIEVANVDQAKETSAQDNQATTLVTVKPKEMPELPSTSSSLSISSGFVLATETLVSTVLSNPPSVTTITPIQQQTTPIPTPPITIVAPSVTIAIPIHLQQLFKDYLFLRVNLKHGNKLIILRPLKTEYKQTSSMKSRTNCQSFYQQQFLTLADECLSELELKIIFFEKMDKRDRGDDEDKDHSARLNQGKKTKRRRTKESESSKKSSTLKDASKEEVIIDVEDNTANDDVVNDADQSQDDSMLKIDNATKNNWFKQPLSLLLL